MFINDESHFSQVPSIDIQRSKFITTPELKTSFNVGDIIPIYVDSDILPSDSLKMTLSSVVRLQTLLTPIMDNLVIDFSAWFVPHRLVWSHWKEFMQENTAGPWAPTTQYQIPSISAPASTGFNVGTLADYMGLPVGLPWNNTDKNAPSALPFRAYAMICDQFWRDENLTYPLNIPTGDTNQTGTNGSSYINDVANGGMPFKAAKTHDMFTSCLPTAQKNSQPVTFPLLSNTKAPVITGPEIASTFYPLDYGMRFRSTSGSTPGNGTAGHYPLFANTTAAVGTDPAYADLHTGSAVSTSDSQAGFVPSNLYADLGSTVGAVTVNELRLAFQLQRWYENSARAGSRYTETIRQFFGCVSPDARLQRPEYLGGKRVPIQINSVVNTSSDSGSSSVPLGALGATSNTSDVDVLFDHSFTEHGTLIILACVRQYQHTYGQGIDKMWLRKTFTDFYWPTFAHLGEMPIKSVSIYADGNMDNDDVFGYNEAWVEYRQHPSKCTGLMRPGVSGSLASWHLADYYTTTPTLSDTWIREPVSNVDRVLAVTSSVSNQCFGDFFFKAEFTRAMPVYSVPGLIDHF